MAAEAGITATLFTGLEKIYTALATAFPTLLFVGAVLLVSYIAINILQRVVKRVLDRVDFNPDLEYLAYRATAWIAWFFVIIWLVGNLGQEEIFATLIAGGTLAGLAVALAVKDSLADVVGGILLLQDKHFDLGDRVRVAGIEGVIVEVDLRKTRIKTDNGQIEIVPNAKIDKGGWTLLPRQKQRERLFTRMVKKAKKAAPLRKGTA